MTCAKIVVILHAKNVCSLVQMKKSLRNIPITSRIMVVVLACVSVIFIFMLVMSILYVHASVEAQQRRDLITRAEYIQSYLRSLYYWDVTLTPLQADGLTIDLRDLSSDMQQDIHVYALNGELLASSSPQLFDGGILSRNMNPSKPFFSDDHIALFYEQIKDLDTQEIGDKVRGILTEGEEAAAKWSI